MAIDRIFAIVLRQFYLIRGSAVRIVPMVVWVAIDIVLWGFITRYLNGVGAGFSFVPVFLGAVLFWGFFIRVMHGVTTAFMEDTWSRNFLNSFASPLTMAEYVTGLVITSIATSAIGLLAMLAIAMPFFGLSFAFYGIVAVPCLFILFLFGIALGIFASGIMLRLGPASEWLIWPIPALLSPLACVFYPLATLPEWMQLLAQLLPTAYVFESLRAAALSGEVAIGQLWISGALAMGYIVLACFFLIRVYRHAVKTGLIARFSAETVN